MPPSAERRRSQSPYRKSWLPWRGVSRMPTEPPRASDGAISLSSPPIHSLVLPPLVSRRGRIHSHPSFRLKGFLHLKRQLQPNLDLAGGFHRLQYFSCRSIVERGSTGASRGGPEDRPTDLPKVCMIEEVEELGAKLQIDLLGEVEGLVYGKVETDEAWTNDSTLADIAVRSHRRQHKHAGIKIAIGCPQLLPRRNTRTTESRSFHRIVVHSRGQVRAIISSRIPILTARKPGADGKREAGPQRGHHVHLPPEQELLGDAVQTASKRQVVGQVGGEVMPHVHRGQASI